MRKPEEFNGWPPELHAGFGPYRGLSRITSRWDDADSFWIWADHGHNTYAFDGYRLLGVDAEGTRAPEARTEEERQVGLRAKAFTLERVPYNTRLKIYTEQDPEKYGRYLAGVFYLDAEGSCRCLNLELAAANLATVREDWGWSAMVLHCVTEAEIGNFRIPETWNNSHPQPPILEMRRWSTHR